MTNEERELTTTEAAKILGVSRVAVNNWCNDGMLKFERVNPYNKKSPKKIRFSEVARFLELRQSTQE